MNKIVWAVAAAVPCLLVACAQKDCPKVEPGDVLAIAPMLATDQEKSDIRVALDKFVVSQMADKKLADATSWDDAIKDELPIDFTRCFRPDRAPVPNEKCHLYVEKVTETESTPKRFLRITRNGTDQYTAQIRSVENADEYMYCPKLTIDQAPNYISGYCDIQPHVGSTRHWVVIRVIQASSTLNFTSVFFEYWDKKPASNEEPVHNGEGHGGDS